MRNVDVFAVLYYENKYWTSKSTFIFADPLVIKSEILYLGNICIRMLKMDDIHYHSYDQPKMEELKYSVR